MTVLPVRPAPRPSEPLSSYAVRLADANGIHRARVLPRYRHDIDIPTRELDTVAALAGLDGEAARRLTMNRYPLAIRGHGIQRRHGWRHHFEVVWLCPACTLTTGHTDLLWQTALMPVCLRCRCYLVQAGAAHTVTPAHPRVLELAEILRDLAEAAIDQPRARGILYRLRRRCQAWPAPVDPGLDANPDLPRSTSRRLACGAPTRHPTPARSRHCSSCAAAAWSATSVNDQRTPDSIRPPSSPPQTEPDSTGSSPACATTSPKTDSTQGTSRLSCHCRPATTPRHDGPGSGSRSPAPPPPCTCSSPKPTTATPRQRSRPPPSA
ncbi:MAG: TniQ family protein [Actinomycetales bacterium]|uniref:TniQ family protein n=1 Tax=Candidatus Phosphoribacter hodrii TaxID=2953743 RepID=A0A9D7T8Y9_9MICO|nr:TniQ family protein [Candidatus Phosphoribacter hodrii]